MQMRWRLYASQIIYVGDNITKDFQAPKQLGMKCLYIKNDNGIYNAKEEPIKMLKCQDLLNLEMYID